MKRGRQVGHKPANAGKRGKRQPYHRGPGMTAICPCCGNSIIAARAPIEALEAAPLETQQRLIIRLLVKAYPGAVSTSTILDRLYSGTRNGGIRSFSTAITRARKLIAPFGWTIPDARQGRGHPGSYRLEPLP